MTGPFDDEPIFGVDDDEDDELDGLEVDEDLERVIATFCSMVEQEGYEYPIVAFRQVSEFQMIRTEEEIGSEDELRLLEMLLQQTGLAMPGAVAFCRRDADGFHAVAVDWDEVHFLHLDQIDGGWTVSEVPRPGFWAVTPNRDPEKSAGGAVQ